MKKLNCNRENIERADRGTRMVAMALAILMLFPFDYFTPKAVASAKANPEPVDLAQTPAAGLPSDSVAYLDAEVLVREPLGDDMTLDGDTTKTVVVADDYPYGLDGKKIFNPDPTRAVWMSALCPGLGQIYNRRYWKLPIVVGGFMGLGYATNWNNTQYQDYMQGYRDILDNDPNTDSYMDFFPPTVSESDVDHAWLESVMKSRKDFYRRNRDLCIICLVALYLVCMVDSYVDASMAHFDISPDLSMDVAPAMLIQPASRRPALGLNWALTF